MLKRIIDDFFGVKNKKNDEYNVLPKPAKSLEKNIQIIKDIIGTDETIIFRNFQNQKGNGVRICTVFIKGMVDEKLVNDSIIRPIITSPVMSDVSSKGTLDILLDRVITSNHILRTSNMDKAIGSILYGDTLLIIDGVDEFLIIGTTGWQTRAVEEPESEKIVKGPREGFVESIVINLSLLRRRITSPDLKFIFKEIGTRTKTKVCVCYMEGIANKKILDELIKRLDDIQIDSILAAGYIEELIKDSPLSPFETIFSTDRPDTLSGKLLEGRLGVIVDGTPTALSLPFLFMEYFQVNEDYYQNFIFSSFNRIIRMVGFFLTTGVPAIYVALTTYHQEIMPTPLLQSISEARQGVPLPTIVEAILMLLVFEVLREAGVRLPTAVGQAISIVGALVLGEAAVNARFVSAPMVIITALTGITGFLLPKMLGGLIVTRIIFLLLSAFMGLYGYIFGVFGLSIHLMSMRSFGVPYMLGYGLLSFQEFKDTTIRAPWWLMYLRPGLISRDLLRKTTTGERRRG